MLIVYVNVGLRDCRFSQMSMVFKTVGLHKYRFPLIGQVSVLFADAEAAGEHDRRVRRFPDDGAHHLQRPRDGQPQRLESQEVHQKAKNACR